MQHPRKSGAWTALSLFVVCVLSGFLGCAQPEPLQVTYYYLPG